MKYCFLHHDHIILSVSHDLFDKQSIIDNILPTIDNIIIDIYTTNIYSQIYTKSFASNNYLCELFTQRVFFASVEVYAPLLSLLEIAIETKARIIQSQFLNRNYVPLLLILKTNNIIIYRHNNYYYIYYYRHKISNLTVYWHFIYLIV